MKSKVLVICLFCILVFQASAQLTSSQYRQLDSLFTGWNKPNHPGGAIGVMINGKTVFSKAFGLASLEYLVPNQTETIFNTASVSKQFTAMGIVLLHLEGKLSIDDDIRKHLPELPDFGEVITIRHMLHHTSGLRSMHALLGLAGWRGDDTRNNDDLYRLMLKQKELNFIPGSEHLYCNTGYMFMALIIEKITGETFRDWMQRSVFEPLGLLHTYVEDQYNRVVPQNATSYYGNYDRGFNRAVEYWGYVGSGNMHSTIPDLLRWLNNFSDPQEGWKPAFELLQTVDLLNNGVKNNYAFGVVIDEFQGVPKIQHGGSIGGFRTAVCAYPDKQMNIAILSNFSSSSVGQKMDVISKILLRKKPDDPTVTADTKLVKGIRISNKKLKKYEGSYWNKYEKYVRKIYLKDDTLRYYRSENNESPLLPIAQNKFLMLGIQDRLVVSFEDISKLEKTMKVHIENGPVIPFKSFDRENLISQNLGDYTGKYFSPELEVYYSISIQNKSLKAYHVRHGLFDLEFIYKDVLEADWPLGRIEFQRNSSGKISGMRVTNGRVRNLWLDKIE